jgi:hypothetical protein
MRRIGYMTAIAVAVLSATVAAQKITDLGVEEAGARTSNRVDDRRGAPGDRVRPAVLKGRPEADDAAGRTVADRRRRRHHLITDKPLKFGSLSVPAGRYTINTEPGTPWQLILGRLGDGPPPNGVPTSRTWRSAAPG